MNRIVNLLYYINKYFGWVLTYKSWNKLLFKINSFRRGGQYYNLSIDDPKTFNEKILFLKRQKSTTNHVLVADKFKVRQYVSRLIGEEFLIPLLWVSSSIQDFEMDVIPNNCVVKLNNGSGYNFIIKNDLSKIKFKNIKRILANSFKKDFSKFSKELHYKYIKPRILIEKLIDYPLNDYKFFCSNGKPFMIQVDIDRFTKHKRNFYNLSWEKQELVLNYDNYSGIINQPKNLDMMIEISKKLSNDFNFCRVDLYVSNNNIYFGEITLFPGGGVELFKTYKMDLEMGNLIQLLNDA